MKYQYAYDQVIGFLREDWMDDEDFDEFRSEIEPFMNRDEFDRNIDYGIENGYPIAFQLEIYKKIYNK